MDKRRTARRRQSLLRNVWSEGPWAETVVTPCGWERGRGASGELSVKAPSEDKEEVEEDPFDTSIVDKVVPLRRAEKRSEISVEDDDFDPTATFKKSKEIQQSLVEEPDPFDTSVAVNALPEEERRAELERRRKEAEEKARKEQEPSPDISDDDFDPRAF